MHTHVAAGWCYLGGDGAGLQLGAVGLDLLVQDVMCCDLLLYIREFGSIGLRLLLLHTQEETVQLYAAPFASLVAGAT